MDISQVNLPEVGTLATLTDKNNWSRFPLRYVLLTHACARQATQYVPLNRDTLLEA
jgi:hypothetical protein